MSRAADLRRLGALAGLLREAELSRLSAARAARDRTERQIADLNPLPPAAGIDPAAALHNAAVYAAWAERRRRALGEQLAAQTARAEALCAAAAQAFGRAQVLDTLAARRRRRPPD
jgi:hypothetical protein